MAHQAARMSGRDISAYLFLALAWGLSFIVLMKVVHAFGWAGAVSFRCLVAGSTLLVAARLARKRLSPAAPLRHLVAVGATTVAGQLVCLSYATPRIGTAMAAILVAAIPLFSMVIARVWGLERLSVRRVVGLGIGVGGIVLLVGFPAEPLTAAFLGDSAVALAGSFFAAFGSNYVNRHLRDAGSWEVTSGAFLSGGVIALPLLLVVPVPAMPGLADFGALLVLGGVMSALTYVIYFDLVGRIGPTRAISVEFLVTVIAVLAGALLLGEALTMAQLAGGAVIMLGCALLLGDLAPLRGRRQGQGS